MVHIEAYVSCQIWENFLAVISSNTFLLPSSLSSPFRMPVTQMLAVLLWSHRSLRLYSFLFLFSVYFLSAQHAGNSILLSPSLLILSSFLFIVPLSPYIEFLILVIVFVFKISLVLLYISFSPLVSPMFVNLIDIIL